jgi:hypothetical protein
MFLSNLFHRNKKDDLYEDTLYEEQTYAALETETDRPRPYVVKDLHSSKEAQTKNYVVDLCEQMVNASEDFDETKEEYRLVTNQLTDVQIIEDLTEEDRQPLEECARHINELGEQRDKFLKTKHRISEEQFTQMQEEESVMPGIIRRLKANEAQMDAVKKDMAFLEGKKLEWSMQKNDAIRLQKIMRRVVIVMLALCVTMLVLFIVLSTYTRIDIGLGMSLTGFIAAVAATYIFVRYQDSTRDIRQADVNRNHAITLENRSKIKYVNSKNAVDFTCEKYSVRNAKELETLFERYKEEVKHRESFQKTSEELDYYSRTFVQQLTLLRMYDARAWLAHTDAILNPKELVELKRSLVLRRQKLRDRMETSLKSLAEMKHEALLNINKFGSERQQVEDLIRKIDALTPSL